MAEIIAEPSALSKIIPVSFKINDTDSVTTTRLATKKQFNTTDTDAWLSFDLDGIETTNGEFDLTLINVDENPSSIFHHTSIAFPGIPFHYKLDAGEDLTKNEIRHAGRWIGQVIIRLANGDTTTRQFDFAIAGHLLDGKEARVILIEDYNALIATITASKTELEGYNIDYAALIADVDAKEALREQAEIDRAATFDALVESEMVAQNVATKLTEKEATFAPRMLSVEQQLEQTDQRVSETIANAGDGTLPTEVVDMRVLASGTVATTAGDALRETQKGKAILPSAITPSKLNVSMAHVQSNHNNISVDTANRTVTVSADTVIMADNNNLTIPPQVKSYAANPNPSWAQHVYFDNVSKELLILQSGSIPNQKLYYLFTIYSARITGGNKNITINGKRADFISSGLIEDGAVIDSKIPDGELTHSKLAEQIGHIIENDALEINYQDAKVYVKKTLHLIRDSGFITIETTHPPVDFPGGFSHYASYKIYVDTTTNTIKMVTLSTKTKQNPIIAIVYNRQFAVASYHAIYGVDSTGNAMPRIGGGTGGTSGSTFDWANNRFLLPKELYLLTDVEYSVTAQRFNYNRFSDDDDLLFEMISPTQAITFENTANISSPFEVALNTRIGGIFNGNKADALYKNVKLNFRKPESMVNKQPRVLMIGDSITYGLLPSYTKWWMEKFGATPTMIGTTSNSYALYGLGIEPALSGSPGEGRGGWRLTDYTGTTKRKDGSTYLMASNPFWNPTTQAFDFAYYMTNNGYDVSGVDNVVIQLGTNDISGWHNLLVEETIDMPTIEEVVAYMPVEYQKMIDSIHLYDPTIKIGFNPPPLAGIENTFNDKVSQFTEILLHNFDGTQANVYCLANYLSNAPLTGKTHYDAETSLVAVSAINDTKRGAVSTDVHDAETNIMVTSLYTASWIINQG